MVSAATWDLYDLELSQDADGRTLAEKTLLPSSYKIEGTIFNGLTYEGTDSRFYSGATASGGGGQTFETFAIFNNDEGFWSALTTNFSEDTTPKRALAFGTNKWDGFGREITKLSENAEDFTDIEYEVKEAIPYTDEIPQDVSGVVHTERYEGDSFDQTVLDDVCSLIDAFIEEPKIKVTEANSGITGQCSLYTEETLPENTKYYITSVSLFDSGAPLTITDEAVYCYGTYNENAQYNVKGAVAIVRKVGDNRYTATIKREDGTEINITGADDELNASGVSLLHSYTLNSAYTKNISEITAIINSGSTEKIYDPADTGITSHIATPNDTAATFSGNTVKTIIAEYTKPDDGTKNKMVVYKLYPYEMLDVMFPPQQGGD